MRQAYPKKKKNTENLDYGFAFYFLTGRPLDLNSWVFQVILLLKKFHGDLEHLKLSDTTFDLKFNSFKKCYAGMWEFRF